MLERRAIRVRGIVQGVGFRPFVHRLASSLGLGGTVSNGAGDVVIEVEGPSAALDRLLVSLAEHAPCLAQIDDITWTSLPPTGERCFRIIQSRSDVSGHVFVSPDVATCVDCQRELFDENDRRSRYPFLNCTNCGPRLTIVTGAPYDRPQTTMSAFEMCAACRREYEDPGDRRFHAQPIACADCGPAVCLRDASGTPIACDDPLTLFATRLLANEIGALKGVGGYHLVCDARHERIVRELRRRKHRDEKPFAVMVRDVEAANALCDIDEAERRLLTSSQAPIVLLRKRNGCPIAPSVAPQNPWLGVMLPYTPLHHLLLEAINIPLVMTSGNRSDEPIAFLDDDALERLRGIADVSLTHNRLIHVRCEDSVTRIVEGEELSIRRSRGAAPQPMKLVRECPFSILAVGGQLKVTFALGFERHAVLSHHLGDLDQFDAFRAFQNEIELYEDLFDVRPACIAHDLHPDYASTRYAAERAAREGLSLVAVQHHHAHLASCLAENGISGPVIGVVFDGSGYGLDGAIWGGEFLVGDAHEFRRAAHLRYVGLPGGDQAVRQPWRMAWSHLLDADCDCSPLTSRHRAADLRTVRAMMDKRLNTPLTSSMGRLFDAVACLSGGRDRVSYEGQAAVELEWWAMEERADGSYPFELSSDTHSHAATIIDTRPLIRAVARDVTAGVSRARIARRFHSTVVEMIVDVCRRLRSTTGLNTVALTGGVFLNALLTADTSRVLAEDGFDVVRHHVIPPGDGGLSLGQVAVAAAQLRDARDNARRSAAMFADTGRIAHQI